MKKVVAVVVVTNHKDFVNMDLKKLKRHGIKVVIDGKNCLDKDKIVEMGINYKGIGR